MIILTRLRGILWSKASLLFPQKKKVFVFVRILSFRSVHYLSVVVCKVIKQNELEVGSIMWLVSANVYTTYYVNRIWNQTLVDPYNIRFCITYMFIRCNIYHDCSCEKCLFLTLTLIYIKWVHFSENCNKMSLLTSDSFCLIHIYVFSDSQWLLVLINIVSIRSPLYN